MTGSPELSIIIPVYNGAQTLPACLAALQEAPGPHPEIIVVDGGSNDELAEIAMALGVRLHKQGVNLGQSTARNQGAELARREILVFVDADVVIHADALERISKFFTPTPEYSALFGSYGTRPAVRTVVSQYRNLPHHFAHQHGEREAETLWTGLGAVRKSASRPSTDLAVHSRRSKISI